MDARAVATLEAEALERAEHQRVRQGLAHEEQDHRSVDLDRHGVDAVRARALVLLHQIGRDVLLLMPAVLPRLTLLVSAVPHHEVLATARLRRAVVDELVRAVHARIPDVVRPARGVYVRGMGVGERPTNRVDSLARKER